MFENLKEIKQVKKDRKTIESLIKQAIEAKKKSIESKERLLELMDMIVINRINMIEEIQFIEKRQEISKTVGFRKEGIFISGMDRMTCNSEVYKSMRVSDLVEFFERRAKEGKTDGKEKPQDKPEIENKDLSK